MRHTTNRNFACKIFLFYRGRPTGILQHEIHPNPPPSNRNFAKAKFTSFLYPSIAELASMFPMTPNFHTEFAKDYRLNPEGDMSPSDNDRKSRLCLTIFKKSGKMPSRKGFAFGFRNFARNAEMRRKFLDVLHFWRKQ